jgi:diaminopropionate ammonia-lyase
MFVNFKARAWTCSSTIDVEIDKFHRSLPGYSQTPLLDCRSIAAELGLKNVFLKDESARMGLPAFKILGASWATYKAIAKLLQLPTTVNVQIVIDGIAQKHQGLTLFAATEGNHGRAVAKMATLLGMQSQIFVPEYLNTSTRSLIEKEGACVVEVLGDYNEAVTEAKVSAHVLGVDGLLIQDTAFEGYEDIPQVQCPRIPPSQAKAN